MNPAKRKHWICHTQEFYIIWPHKYSWAQCNIIAIWCNLKHYLEKGQYAKKYHSEWKQTLFYRLNRKSLFGTDHTLIRIHCSLIMLIVIQKWSFPIILQTISQLHCQYKIMAIRKMFPDHAALINLSVLFCLPSSPNPNNIHLTIPPVIEKHQIITVQTLLEHGWLCGLKMDMFFQLIISLLIHSFLLQRKEGRR